MKRLKFLMIFAAISLLLSGTSYPEEYKEIASEVSAKIPLPKGYHEGLYFDGKNIWVTNGMKINTWVVDPATGSVIREIEPVGTFTEDIAYKGDGKYFLTDWYARKVYTVRIEGDKMIAESEKSVAAAHPTGVEWTGKDLFIITWTRSMTGTKFHILKMDENFNILSRTRFKKISEPCQLAWDGKNLWVSCWYSKRVYKLDVEKKEILGYIRSPVDKATGIAWDGKYLWLTGTSADLYKIELKE